MAKKRKRTALKLELEAKSTKAPEVDVAKSEDDDDDEEEEFEEIEVEEEVEESEEEIEEEAEESEEEEEEEEEETSEEEEEEEEEEGSKTEILKKLLEPFGKDQIIEFLKDAALKDRSILNRLTESAESDPAHRKIFIHGLGWDATTEQVLSVFKKYGEIEECKVVTDKLTSRAKGYGFVLFKTRRGAKKSLKEPQKKIGSRMTSSQLASAGPVPNQPSSDIPSRKIFVANVGPQVNRDALRALFAKFGEIEEGPIGFDSSTGKFKGYAMFLYKTIEGCNSALAEPVKVFKGSTLQCSRATTKNQNQNQKQALTPPLLPPPTSLQQSGLNAAMNYGMNPAFFAPNMNQAAALMMSQNAALGLANPMLYSALNQQALAPAPSGVGNQSSRLSGNYGINSISPSAIGTYAPHGALQGYQSGQLGYPSSSAGGPTSTVTARSQPGLPTTYSSYMGL